MELVEGRTGTTQDGRRVQVRNGRVVYIDQPIRGGQRQSSKFNETLDRAAANNVMAARENAAGALGRISEAESLINRIPQTPSGFLAPTQLYLGGLGLNNQQTRNLRDLERFAGSAALGQAAALKPLSNSDMQFLMQQQAGVRERPETNRSFLRARQWADAKILGKTAAMDSWINELGSPNAQNARGQSFDVWWSQNENNLYPRPNNNERGSYIPRRATRPQNNTNPRQQQLKQRFGLE